MAISDWVIASGPITYIAVWIIVLILLLMYEFSPTYKAAMIAYAALPIGAICQTGCGYILAACGL
jgi:hypothetical protein